MLATQAPGEPSRLYVVEQRGLVRVFEGGRLRSRPFLDLRGRVSTENEQGLLGLAFGPDYVKRKRIYVNYTDTDGATIIAEYQVKNGAAVPGTARRLLAGIAALRESQRRQRDHRPRREALDRAGRWRLRG